MGGTNPCNDEKKREGSGKDALTFCKAKRGMTEKRIVRGMTKKRIVRGMTEEDSARHDGWMREFFSHHEERKRRGDLCGLPRV